MTDEEKDEELREVMLAAHSAAALALWDMGAEEPDGRPAISVVQAIKALQTLRRLVERVEKKLAN